MLVVSLIVAMVFLIVMPRVIRAPKRMAIEQMLTDLRQACLETSARARATGTELELRLETDGGYGGMFIVAAASDITLSQDWSPPMPTNQEEQLSAAVLATINRYPLPADIEWQGLQDYSEDNPCRFVFYPDGEATGPKLRFTFKGIDYELSVDSLTGKPIIMEFAK
jgi:type II secretory pathway pseudopilin PulG